MAGCAPVKDTALQLRGTELVKFKDGRTITTVVKPKGEKPGDKKTLRVEPENQEEFRKVLAEAKAAAAKEKHPHFFSVEMEGMNETENRAEEGAETFIPNVLVGRVSYWIRSLVSAIIFIIVLDLGIKVSRDKEKKQFGR